jgi:hypothetical protein
MRWASRIAGLGAPILGLFPWLAWFSLIAFPMLFGSLVCPFWHEAGRICLIMLMKRGLSFLKDKKRSLAFHARLREQ